MLLLMKNKYRNQKGFSLLEALLSIVIIVAAGLGVVELFISADKKNKAQATQTIVQQAASAMSQLLSTSYNNSNLSTSDVVKSGLIANTYIKTDGTIIGPYGQLTVNQADTPSEYYVVAAGIPGDQAINICQNMLTSSAVSVGTALASQGMNYIQTISACQSSFPTSSTKYYMSFSFPREDFISSTT